MTDNQEGELSRRQRKNRRHRANKIARERMARCEQKVKYLTLAGAERARLALKYERVPPRLVETYQCPFCGFWHHAKLDRPFNRNKDRGNDEGSTDNGIKEIPEQTTGLQSTG